MFADRTGHAADNCRACAVARVALTIESHDEERPAWREMLPFLKEVSAAIDAVAALQRAAAERAAAQRPTTAEAWAPLDLNARHVEVKRFTSAEMCRHIDPLLEFTKSELERFRQSHLSLFDSPEHATLPKANPPRPTLKSVTVALYRAGFTAKEIVMLVDDGGDQDLASPKSKEFADAVARVYKRIPSNGTAARKTTPKAPDSTRRHRKRSQR